MQESLNNALKYSRAARITIGARYSRAGYEVWVEDNGVGLPDPPSEGRGLANMRRRARDLGGSLRVERGALGVGTLVALSLPLTTGVAPA
ncbi:MAG: sensor histidine kinase [Gammaproteobacteria bacterium]